MLQDHWDTHTVDFIGNHLAHSESLIRIATGYFTIQGYDLLRDYLNNKTVLILVGYDEKVSQEQLREKMVDDIMAHLSQWDAPNRRAAVLDLIGKLQRGELYVVEKGTSELINARIRKRDHAKLYIIDDRLVLVGSSNLTVSGLRYNYEAILGADYPDRVAQWVEWFEQYWNAPDTYDLTLALLEALLRWLELSQPYDVYLKTVQALVPEDDTEAPRPSYKMPTKFQMVIIERVLRQLKDWRGAMLVASTGLGKTIMATHIAHRLHHRDRKILNVLVFAPLQIQPDWERALESAGLSYKIFTRNLLDQPLSDKRSSPEVKRILAALDNVDDKYIIFIDESQYFNNRLRAKDGKLRFSFDRLVDVVNQKSPYIVLLTATPLAKGVEDLNNQLYLLPHVAPKNSIRADGQMAFPGLEDWVLEPNVWQVSETDHFFDEFMNLPVCTVISTSQVAKDFAVSTPEGDYVLFGQEKRWIPEIELWKVKVPMPLERLISEALDDGYFRHRMLSFQKRGIWQKSESTIEQQLNLAWASSPLALREVLETTSNDTYQVDFIKNIEDRQQRLQPILNVLLQQEYTDDQKFLALVECLRRFQKQGSKVIVFTERLATAVYLEKMLAQAISEMKIANVVRETEGGYALKDFESEVLELIYDFAPEANRDKIPEEHAPKHYDVFITTDAYGVGVNLQDANVVISYDLAWTADTIIQRAGRILRFWSQPRRVYLYAFVGHFQENIHRQRAARLVEERLKNLTVRTRWAEKFSELPMLPDAEKTEFTSLGNLSNVSIEDLGSIPITEVEEFSGVSRFLKHITELNQNIEYANAIPDDITSAMAYSGRRQWVYLLLRYNREYSWTVLDVISERLIDLKEDDLLDFIQCHRDTPNAPVDPDLIEQQAQKAKAMWCTQFHIEYPEEVERICALYLVPESKVDHIDSMLKSSTRP